MCVLKVAQPISSSNANSTRIAAGTSAVRPPPKLHFPRSSASPRLRSPEPAPRERHLLLTAE